MRNIRARHVAGNQDSARIVRADGWDKLRAAATWPNNLPLCRAGRGATNRTYPLKREAQESEEQGKRDKQTSPSFRFQAHTPFLHFLSSRRINWIVSEPSGLAGCAEAQRTGRRIPP